MRKIEELQTPYFLIQTKIVDELIENLRESLKKYWINGICGYSFKTNNLPWIIKYMKDKGLWAEVVSSDEYNLAKKMGYNIANIIFNGPVKGKEEFIEAVENGAIVNIDSVRELNWLKECDKSKLKKSKIGLRINFCIEEWCPGESQGGNVDGRFGFSYEMGDLKNAMDFLLKNNVKLSGLHLHCSSKTRSLNVYKTIAKMSVNIVKEYNLKLDYIDIGGGFFGGVPGKPTFIDYISTIKDIFGFEKKLENVNLIIEPGMSIIGAGIDYVTSVVDIKRTKNNNFVVLDGSRIHIDPLMRKVGYIYEIKRSKSDRKESNKIKQILCGFTCMEGDRFFELEDFSLEVDDKIVFKKVGAYTMGLSPQFIEFYPCVYANIEEKLEKVRKKNKAEDFFKQCF